MRAVTLDLADARIVNAVLHPVSDEARRERVAAALAAKDAATLGELAAGLAPQTVQALLALVELYGDEAVLRKARERLPAHPAMDAALRDLQWLCRHIAQTHPAVRVGVDLADLGGYAYYSGARFAIYAAGANDALVRGGRYDEVGAIFGRNRPAVGFSLDLKTLAELAPGNGARAAIRAPWGEDAGLREAVRGLLPEDVVDLGGVARCDVLESLAHLLRHQGHDLVELGGGAGQLHHFLCRRDARRVGRLRAGHARCRCGKKRQDDKEDAIGHRGSLLRGAHAPRPSRLVPLHRVPALRRLQARQRSPRRQCRGKGRSPLRPV